MAFHQTVSVLNAAKDGLARTVAPKNAFKSRVFEGQPVSRGPLADFGLESTHTDWDTEVQDQGNALNGSSSSMPLLSHIDGPISGNLKNENNFLVLNRFRLAPKNEGWGVVSDFDQFFTVSLVLLSLTIPFLYFVFSKTDCLIIYIVDNSPYICIIIIEG